MGEIHGGQNVYIRCHHGALLESGFQAADVVTGLAVDFWKNFDELHVNWCNDKEWQPLIG
jgi:hypothetical protein